MGEPHFSPVWGRKSLVYKIGKMSSKWNICDSRKDKKEWASKHQVFPQSSVHIVLHGSSSARVLNRAALIPDRETDRKRERAVCLHCPLLTERSNDIPHSNPPCQSRSFYLREQSGVCGRRGIYYYIKSICNSSLRGILFGLGWMWDGFLLSGDKWAVSWSLLQTWGQIPEDRGGKEDLCISGVLIKTACGIPANATRIWCNSYNRHWM